MVAWDKSSLQQMAQGVAGYLDTARLAGDVEEVVRELRSLTPKVDSLGTLHSQLSSFRFVSSCLVQKRVRARQKICIHIYIHMYMHVCVYIHICICMYVCVYVYVYV